MKFIISLLSLVLIINVFVKAQTNVYINTGKENQPISKYVYGQFIEHLGKSVYGGLWAEMILEMKCCTANWQKVVKGKVALTTPTILMIMSLAALSII